MIVSGIYKIQSVTDPNRIYIGSAINITKRWTMHLSLLNRGKHANKKLQGHYDKYGKNDLIFSVIINCEKEDLIIIEQSYIDELKPSFNIRRIANSNIGLKLPWTEERKQKARGRICTEETRQKQSKAMLGNKNSKGCKLPVTEETREKMRKNNLGKKLTKKSIQKRTATQRRNRELKLINAN